MRTEIGTTVHRHDYQPFPFDIPKVELEFDLDPDLTLVAAHQAYLASRTTHTGMTRGMT